MATLDPSEDCRDWRLNNQGQDSPADAADSDDATTRSDVREGGVELLASDVVDVDREGSVLLVPASENLVDVVRLRGI